MEASALHAPAGLSRLPLPTPLLRLRSDEQLLAAFRSGSDDAFGVLHERYRQRLFVYVRQMLSAASRQDAEDVLQDVFVRAYGALRADGREMNLRAWLYRVAHNRCIDHLRRPVPPAADIFEVSRKPLHDPLEEAHRREHLARLVQDIARLPEQQRSALLMREIDGMSYDDLAAALDVTVPAVKSLLVRARVGLVEAAEARDADCEDIRADLLDAYDRGVKASGRARRHMRTCPGCTEYRGALRSVQRSFAALSPIGLGPLALVANLLGLGGAGGGAATGGAAAAGGTAAGGALVAGKVAAVVCTAAIAGGATEAKHDVVPEPRAPTPAAHAAPVPAMALPPDAVPTALAPKAAAPVRTRAVAPVPAPAPAPAAASPAPARLAPDVAPAPVRERAAPDEEATLPADEVEETPATIDTGEADETPAAADPTSEPADDRTAATPAGTPTTATANGASPAPGAAPPGTAEAASEATTPPPAATPAPSATPAARSPSTS